MVSGGRMTGRQIQKGIDGLKPGQSFFLYVPGLRERVGGTHLWRFVRFGPWYCSFEAAQKRCEDYRYADSGGVPCIRVYQWTMDEDGLRWASTETRTAPYDGIRNGFSVSSNFEQWDRPEKGK